MTSESDPKDGSEKFMSYIKGNFDTSSINQFYSQCLQGLQRSYSREILLSILADASETLEDSSKDLIKSQESFQKVCDLVHNQFQAGSNMQEKFSNSHMVQNSEQKILAVLNFMHPVEEFRAFFIDDLLTRAKNCLNMAVKDDDKALMLNKSIRKSDEITDPVLDP